VGRGLGCVTVYVTFRGVYGPKVPTAGGAASGPRQYVQLGGTEKVLAHRLAWVFAKPGRDFTLLTDASVEASHLCGNSLCCNGEHIVMEPRAVNQSRSYCLHAWEDSSVFPPNMIDVCLHYPKCMRRGQVWESVVQPWTVNMLARESVSDPMALEEEGSSSQLLPYLLPGPFRSIASSDIWRASEINEPESASIYEVDEDQDGEGEEAQADSSHYGGSSVFGDFDLSFNEDVSMDS
jgi:Zinc-binding loop region of homing endonuclease